MRAFWELSSTRQFGGVVGPIPWDMIVAYGERKGLDDAMMGVFEDVIRSLDESYLKWQRQKQGQRTEK